MAELPQKLYAHVQKCINALTMHLCEDELELESASTVRNIVDSKVRDGHKAVG